MNPLELEAQRIGAVRHWILETHPFWGALLVGVKLVAEPRLPTFAATDLRSTIWYNPDLTRPLRFEQLGFVLAHEIAHHMFASGARRRGRDPQLWNMATDYAINRVVRRIRHPSSGVQQFRSPTGHHPILGEVEILDDQRFDGLIAEAIYERLSSGKGVPRPEAGGSFQGVAAHGGGIDVHLAEEPDEFLPERLARAAQLYEGAGRRGDHPGALLRAIGMRPPQRAWARVLRGCVAEARRIEYSPRRPNLRYAAAGYIVPGRVDEPEVKIAVALDTSASMSAAQLGALAAELAPIARASGELELIVADAEVREILDGRAIARWLHARRPFLGGGGTDHRPVFAHLAASPPDLLIAMTDLETVFPARSPPYPVLWLVPGPSPKPPFGRVVEVVV